MNRIWLLTVLSALALGQSQTAFEAASVKLLLSGVTAPPSADLRQVRYISNQRTRLARNATLRHHRAAAGGRNAGSDAGDAADVAGGALPSESTYRDEAGPSLRADRRKERSAPEGVDRAPGGYGISWFDITLAPEGGPPNSIPDTSFTSAVMTAVGDPGLKLETRKARCNTSWSIAATKFPSKTEL
jgi:hypothetical protein